MAKFLIEASYAADGAKGLLKEGGTSRRAAVQKVIEGVGGQLEAMYFSLGDTDALVICEFPDVSSVLALSVAVNAAGAAHVSTTQLFSPEEMDSACKKTVSYRAPGS